MITVPTTLVIGAGASKPWGLPTARDLIVAARALEAGSDQLKPLRKALSVRPEELDAFLRDLREDPTGSLDEFLETQQATRTREIGRGLIALLLGQSILEHQSTQPPAAEDWLAIVIQAMRSGARTLDAFVTQNRVRFVTFNFDSIVEQELARRIKVIYKADGEELDRAVAAIPIVHVHGQLPPITSMRSDWVREAADCVRVVHDEIDGVVAQATQQGVGGARVLCFLGFSFHPENLKRLDMRGRLAQINNGSPLSSFACAYELPNRDRERVQAYFGRYGEPIRLASDSSDCAATLRHFYALQDES